MNYNKTYICLYKFWKDRYFKIKRISSRYGIVKHINQWRFERYLRLWLLLSKLVLAIIIINKTLNQVYFIIFIKEGILNIYIKFFNFLYGLLIVIRLRYVT